MFPPRTKRNKSAGTKRTQAPQWFLYLLPEPQRQDSFLSARGAESRGIYKGAALPCTEYLPTRTGGNHLTSRTRIPTFKGIATLPNNISSLSAAEKFALLDSIWEDLVTYAPALNSDQAEELDRHIAANEKNPPTGTPWEQVKTGLPKR